MSRADKRRRRLHTHRQAAKSSLEGPTPERLRRGEIRPQTLFDAAQDPDPRRDWTGQRADALPRKTATSRVQRDLDASARHRLKAFKRLDSAQLDAAERFERDWRLARMEPRMIADLSALGVTSGWQGPEAASVGALDARGRIQAARRALRRGGRWVLEAVETVLIEEATPDRIGAQVYAGRRDASVYARALLSVGLHLLAAHYGAPRAAGTQDR